MDFAQLGLEMDAGEVLRAVQALDKFDGAAGKAEAAADDLAGAVDNLGQAEKRTKRATDELTSSDSKAVPPKQQRKRATDDLRQAQDKLNQSTDKGSGAVSRFMKSILGLSTPLEFLRSTLLAVGAGIGLSALGQLADSYTNFSNRLQVANVQATQFEMVQDRLTAAANRGGAGINAMAALYQRAELSSKSLGASQEKMLKMADAVGAALKVNGGSAESTSGAVMQLGQALSSGTVRAEEFNSMLEGAPTILQMVANGMQGANGSVAKLRNMMLEGNVTSKSFFEAMLKGSDAMIAKAENMETTMAQGYNALTNGLTIFVGEINSSLGVTSALAAALVGIGDALAWVAGHFSEIGQMLLFLSPLLLAAFGPTLLVMLTSIAGVVGGALLTAVTVVTGAFAAFAAAVLANPLFGIPALIIAVVGALYTFREQLGLTSVAWQTFFGMIGNVWTMLTGAFNAVLPILQGIVEYLWQMASAFAEAFGEVAYAYMLNVWQVLTDIASTLYEVGSAVWQALGPTVIASVQTLWAALQAISNILYLIMNAAWQVFAAISQALGSAALDFAYNFLVVLGEIAATLYEIFGPAMIGFMKSFFTGLKVILESVTWMLEGIRDLLFYITGAKIGEGAASAIGAAAEKAKANIISGHMQGAQTGARMMQQGIVSGSQQGAGIIAQAVAQAAAAAAGGGGPGGGGPGGGPGGGGPKGQGDGYWNGKGNQGATTPNARAEYERLNGARPGLQDSDFGWGSDGGAYNNKPITGNAGSGDSELNQFNAGRDWDAFDRENGYGDYSSWEGFNSVPVGTDYGQDVNQYGTPNRPGPDSWANGSRRSSETRSGYASSGSPGGYSSGNLSPSGAMGFGGGSSSSNATEGTGKMTNSSITINNRFSPDNMLDTIKTKKGADTIENVIRSDPKRFAALLGA